MPHAMIVAPQPEAVEAGALVLMRGGNAVDAAMAAALVQGVVDPMMCGIAGFGSMQVYLPKRGVHHCIDFHGRSPAATRPDMWADRIIGETRDGFGFILAGNVNDVGYQSITVPGSLKAYYEAQTEWGAWDWRDVVAPAIKEADAGFIVKPHVHFFWSQTDQLGRVANPDRLRHTAAGRRIFCDQDGNPHGLGARVAMPDMAQTLRRIQAEGADVFYKGSIAQEVAADMARHGGLLTQDDLAHYRTTRIDPLWGSYRGLKLATNNPPGGGITLIEMLNILENFDLAGLGHNTPAYIRIVAEAMKCATADKDAHVGDPAFVDVPVARLTDKAYAKQLADGIRAGRKAHVARVERAKETADTPDIAVVDRDGNAVTMTHSLGMPSGVVTEGLGFMYNGCMGVFDPRPGRAGSMAPGKSRYSSLCPTIVFKGGQRHIIIGAPVGALISVGVLQAILNVVDFDMDMQDAVSAPRFAATSNAIDVMNRIPAYVTDELAKEGYEIVRSPLSYGIAAVHGIRIDGERLQGGADPGHDGMALMV